MRDYRFLTDDEIHVLENNSCWAEDWQRVKVAEEFSPYNFHRVIFYGDLFWECLLRSSDMEDFRFGLRLQFDIHQIPAVKHVHRDPSCKVSGDDPIDDLQTGIH